eukprot:s3190_g7.t5
MQISASKDVRKRFSTLLPHEASLATRRQRIAAEHRRASQRFQRLQVVVRLLPAPEAELATAFLQWHSLLAKRQRRDAEDLVATTVLFAAWKGCVLAEVRARREETWAEAVPLSTFNMEGGGYCSVAQRALPSGGVFRSPMAGLGTCLVSEGDVTRQVSSALDTGYRVIDTAQRYGNEAGIGRALKEAFDKGLRRDEVFVTTKVWPTNYGFDKAIGSVQDSAKKLGLEAIDLVLPHWPGLSTSIEAAESNFRLRRETWKALEQMKKDGLVKNIGVSNYNDRHLTELLDYADTLPMASQFEIHPFNTREMLVQKCQKLGIRVNAYSPLGGKGNPNQVTDKLLSLQLLTDIGSAHGKTPAQTILRWHLQRGVTPIPKASSAKRLGENFDVFDFELSDQEMQEISGLDRRRFAVMDSEEQRGRLANMQLHLVKERRFRRLADARATLAGVQVLEAKLPAGVVGVVPIRAIEEVQALCFAAWQLRTAKNAVRRGNLQSHGEKQADAEISVAQSIAPSLLRAGNCKLMLHAVRCLTAWCRICFTNKCHRHGQKQTLTLTWRCRDVVRRSQVFAAWALVARSSFSRKRAAKVASKAVITARNSKGLCRVFWGWKCAAAVGRSEQQVQQEARASAKECRALCKKVEDRSNRWKERALHLPRHLVSRQVLWAWRLTASSWSRPERELAWRVCRRAMDLQIKALAWRSWEHWVSRAAAMRRLVFASWRQVQLQSLGRRSASQLEALQLHTSTVTQALRTRVRKAFRGAVDFAASSQSQCLLCNAFGQWRRFASAALARPFEGELKEAVTQVQLLAAQRQSCALQQALCSQQRLRAFGWRDLAWMHWRLSCAGRQNRSHSGELAKKMQQLEEQFRTMVSLLNGSRHSFFNTKMHAQDRLLMRRVLQHLKLHTQAERADRELSANEACLQEEFQAFRSLRERGLSSLDSSAARAEQREQTATARCCLAAWHGHCEAAAARGLREDAQERWLRAQNWICRRVPECADARSAQLLLAFWAMRLGALVRGRRDFTRFAMDRLVGCQRDLHLSALAWLSWCAAAAAGQTVQNAAGALVEALEDDKSSESGGQGLFDASAAPEGYAGPGGVRLMWSNCKCSTFNCVGHIWVQLESYAHHSHITVKLVALCLAVGLIATSVLGMVGLWDAKFQIFEYVHSVWNIPFGVLMILMDATPTMLGKQAKWQTELWKKAPILGRARGRALTHFYLGTINLAMFTADEAFIWILIHICMGGSLCACGLIMLFHHHCYQCRRQRHTNATVNGAAAAQNAHRALEILKEEAVEVRAYIAANHCSVRIFCFLVALALVASSVLGMINIFNLVFSPFQYLIGVYNFFFALTMVVLDGESSWFRNCCDCRSRILHCFPFLATQPGRALLHFYVGTINIAMLPGGLFPRRFSTTSLNDAASTTRTERRVSSVQLAVDCPEILKLDAMESDAASTDRCRTLWKLWAQAVDPKPQPVPSRGEHRESRHSARRSQSAPSALDSQDGTVTTPWAFACARFRRKGPRLELGFGDPTNYLISSSLRNGTAQQCSYTSALHKKPKAVLMCSGHGIILQTLLSAAIMIQAWSLEHRNPAEMGLSLGAAGEATGTSQKAEAPGWESFSFNIPSFLAGLTVGILFTVMALGFLTDRLDRRELAEAKEPEAPPAPLPRESLESLHLFGPRCTWLVAMLLVQSVSSLILDSFKGLMQRHMSLTFFLTMLVGLGGNAGGQSVVLTVRRLALGKPVQVSEQLHVGALLVLVMAPLAFVRAYMQQTPLSESLTVGASAAVITICATVVLQCGSSSRRSGRAGPHGHRGNSDCLRPQARRCRGALEALALSLQTRVRNPARSPRGRTRTLLQRLECKRTQLKSESLRLGDAAGLHVVSAVAGSYLRHDEPSFRHLPAKVAVVKLPGCL